METSPAGSNGSESGVGHRLRFLFVSSLILGGAFAFLLLMVAIAGSASAATDQTLTGVSLQVNADSTVDGTADTPVLTADATLSTDGAQVTADTPVLTADATLSTDGAQVTADTPVVSADAKVTLSPTGSPPVGSYVDLVAATPAPPDLGVGASTPPHTGPLGNSPRAPLAPAGPPAPTSLTEPLQGSPAAGKATQPTPSAPGSLPAPQASSGVSGVTTSSIGHGLSGFLARAMLLLLLGLPWLILSRRSRVPHGNDSILALPG